MLMSASPWCEHTYSHICFATLPFGHTRRRRSDGAIAANRAIKRTFIDLQIIWGLPLGLELRFFGCFRGQSKYSLVSGRLDWSVDRLRDPLRSSI